MEEAYIVAYGRSAIGKGKDTGAYAFSRPDDIAGQVLKGVLDRIDGDFTPDMVEDVLVGTAFPEGVQGMNTARNIALLAGLPHSAAGQTINRYCSSGLQTIASAADSIIAGQSEVLVAGGVEFMSKVPMGGNEPTNNPSLQDSNEGISYPMGLTAENVASEYNVSREEQDAFGVESHKRAHEAQQEGRLDHEIIPVEIEKVTYDENGPVSSKETFKTDEGIRPRTDMETLSKLRTIFKKDGSVTAGTSSQVSDGQALLY